MKEMYKKPPIKVDIKVVLLGRYFCGKTSLIQRFIYGTFEDRYSNTIGAAFSGKTITVNGKSVEVAIWDTVGDEKYESLSRMYYRNAKAAVLCYDLTDSKSWDRAKFWVDEVRKNEEDCKIYLCGTKLDLIANQERAVDFRDVSKYAQSIGAKEFETSSKSGENIDEVFQTIVSDYLEHNKDMLEGQNEDITIQLAPTSNDGIRNAFARFQQKCCM
ncbi:ras-related protein Rab-24-like [Clytia hemisphaerica]|uniref:Ras-related protein Rab-24 n=1 Tax=Clytia hemisphaerica TaxID=252671 RepID=A0A7M5XB15_9CNID